MATKKGAIIAIVKAKYGGNEQDTEAVFEELNPDLCSIFSAKPTERPKMMEEAS